MHSHPKSSEINVRYSMHDAAKKYPAGNDYYKLTEISVGHLLIRIPEKNLESASKAIKSVTKLELPSSLEATSNEEYSLFWLSPDEFLLMVPETTEADIEDALRKKMKGHFAIVEVTGGQTLLALSGERAETILKKSTVYDVHESHFPIGKVVTTTFAKSQAIITRVSSDHFQLIVRRSFSDYIWQWIVDAGSRD